MLARHADNLHARTAASTIDPEGMAPHLTWAFLGDVAEDHIPAVAAIFDAAMIDVPGPVECAVTGLSSPGDGTRIVADVDIDELETLAAVRDRFLGAVAPYASLQDVRPWLPHVQLLRTRENRVVPSSLLEGESATVRDVQWISSEMRLIASLPSPGGRQNRLLHRCSLDHDTVSS